MNSTTGAASAELVNRAVIDAQLTTVAGSNQTTTILNNGTIRSNSVTPTSGTPLPNASNAFLDLAIVASSTAGPGNGTGNIVVNNNGVLLGRVNFKDLTGNSTITNTSLTSWHFVGTSTLTAGADTITNTGLIATNAGGFATTLDAGAGTDSFNNNAGGVLVAGELQGTGVTAASNLVISNLENITNNGRIVFGSNSTATPFLSDGGDPASHADAGGGINDKINAAQSAFGGNGVLAMDADLWSTAQTNCATLTAADCLAVLNTSIAGTNSIIVNDNNAHAVGAFNPLGIALVTGSTTANGGAFKLDSTSEWYNASKFGGVLDKPGLFFYDLAWDAGTNRSLLIGVPDIEAFELAQMGSTAQNIWYSTTQSWFDRQADLRDNVSGRAEGTWAPGVWLKVVGDWTDRDHVETFNIFNKSYSFDVGYRQDTAGLIGGIDFLSHRGDGEAYVFGAQLGYVDSDVRFNGSATRADIDGITAGLYGTYLNGGLFVDGIINANFLNLQDNIPSLPTPPNPFSTEGDVTSWGGQIEAGYTMALGANGFWEPLASLSYVHTDFDDLSLGVSGSANFLSTTSFRGSLGARIGMNSDFQYYKVKIALTGRVWDEFDGQNRTIIVSGGPSNFAWTDNYIDGVFGELALSGNLFSTSNGLSAFANAGVKFKDNYQSTNITVGFRYQW
ncbi:MAG: autotransporter domain-containing protein [Caulobacteraceae bacterium]